MEIEIGDVFKDNHMFPNHQGYIESLFKVVEILDYVHVSCEVYLIGHYVSRSTEYKNTLLKMQKLSSLEKELT